MTPFRLLSIAATALLRASDAADPTPAEAASSHLQVHVPQPLFRSGGYPHFKALFGMPKRSGSIAQSVYYADSDLCDPAVDTRKGYPIRSKDKSGNMEPWLSPYILMVDRGGCSFVQKVRNAQRSGAAGVVIADTTCLCSDKDCVSATGQDICQPAEPIMADDGSGGDISIPSFLMFKVDADEIKAEVQANHMVQIEMRWSPPRANPVEYELWTTPSDRIGGAFLEKFGPVARALGDAARFTPHMYIHDGIKNNCQGFYGENWCFGLCTNNGRYCSIDPSDNLGLNVSGADIVGASLRHICIWKHYGQPNGLRAEWWDYMAQFTERCFRRGNFDKFANGDCVKDVYKHSGIEEDIIDSCIRESGGLGTDNTNRLLDLEMQAQVQRGIVILPAAFVNGVEIENVLSVDTVFNAICNGYVEGTEPQICKDCKVTGDVLQCIAKAKGNTQAMTEGMNKGTTEGKSEGVAKADGTSEATAEGVAEEKTKGMNEGTTEGRTEGTAKSDAASEATAEAAAGEKSNAMTESMAENTAEGVTEAGAQTYSSAAFMCLVGSLTIWAMVFKQLLPCKIHFWQAATNKEQRGFLGTKFGEV